MHILLEWETKYNKVKWSLPLLENVKVKIFFFLRMKKSKYSSRRKWKSLPLLENEVFLFMRMKSNDLWRCVFFSFFSPPSWEQVTNYTLPLDHLEKCLQMHFLQSRCVEIVFVSCDTRVTATRRSPQTREVPRRSWEDPPSSLFQTIFWDPWFFPPRLATSYFTLNIANNLSIGCPSDFCFRGELVKSN